MATFALIVALLFQVAMPEEMKCVGFIYDSLLPLDLYISGTRSEGIQALATEGDIIYLGGKGVSSLKSGAIYWVARPEGEVSNKLTREPIGIYYKELGTVRIESVGAQSAIASVLVSCEIMYKGDLLLPQATKTLTHFTGKPSNKLTQYPEGGLASSIILGKNDLTELAAGYFCFIGIGARDGVKPGDRFTIFRPQAPFNIKDLAVAGRRSNISYKRLQGSRYEADLIELLRQRNLPPRALGDLVVLEVAETTASAKIINSTEEIHLGDLVVRR